MEDPQRRQNRITLRKAQLVFVFFTVLTGVIWLLKGRAMNDSQLNVRYAISGTAFAGVVVTTLLLMRSSRK